MPDEHGHTADSNDDGPGGTQSPARSGLLDDDDDEEWSVGQVQGRVRIRVMRSSRCSPPVAGLSFVRDLSSGSNVLAINGSQTGQYQSHAFVHRDPQETVKMSIQLRQDLSQATRPPATQ